MIKSDWQSRLHEYLGGITKNLDAFPQGIGGVEDHVHMLIGFKANHRLSDLMREIKKSSSSWVHKAIGAQAFAWQEGYSAFSVSPTARPAVQRYIQNQAEHHRSKTFKEELIELLEKSGVEFNTKYLQ